TVRRTHHGNLYAHVAQSSDAICPVSFDWGAPLELEAKFGEEFNGGVDVFYHDSDVVHTLDRHDVSLASNDLRLSGRPRVRPGRDESGRRPVRSNRGLDGKHRPTGARATTRLDASADTNRFDPRSGGRHAQWCPIEPLSARQ